MPESTSPPPAEPRVRITIAALLVAQLIGALNWLTIVTALPDLLADLDGTPVQGAWVVTASALGITTTIPVWGLLADRHSPVVLLRIAVGIAVVGAVASTVALSMPMLIAARAVAGIGMGGIVSLGFIILAHITPPRVRGRYLGRMSAVQLAGMLSGPFLGGLIVASPLGWRGCFFVVLPIMVIVLVLLIFAMPLPPRDVERSPIDWLGATILTASVAALLVWVSFVGDEFEFLSLSSFVLIGVVLVGLPIAIVIELRVAAPVLPLRDVRGRVPLLAAIASAAVGMATFAAVPLMTFYFQYGRDVAPTLAGLLLVSIAGGSVFGAMAVGARSSRTGRLRRYLVAGGIFLVLGTTLTALQAPDASLVWITSSLLILGLGQGATMQFIVLAAQNAVPQHVVGSVTGFMNYVQLLGGSIMLSFVTALLGARVSGAAAEGISEAEAYAQGVLSLFWYAAVFAVIGTVAMALLPRIRLRSTVDLEDDTTG